MDKPIIVIDSDGTLIASYRPFPSAYIPAVKPNGTQKFAGVKLKYPIDVNRTLLKVIKTAKDAGYLIVLFTNNNNLETFNSKGVRIGNFLDVAYEAVKEAYNKLTPNNPAKGGLKDGEIFDYVITGLDKERMGDSSTKNMAVLRRVIPGVLAKNVYFFDDHIPNQDIALELPYGNYLRVPSFEQNEDGLSSYKHSIKEVMRTFQALNPKLNIGVSLYSRGSSVSRGSRSSSVSRGSRGSRGSSVSRGSSGSTGSRKLRKGGRRTTRRR